MKKLSVLILAIFFVGYLNAGEWRKIEKQKPENTQVQLISSSENADIIKFNLNAYALERVGTPEGLAFLVSAPKTSPMQVKGAPALSKLSESLIIPNTGASEIEVLYSDYIEIAGIDIAPSKGVIYRDQDPTQVPYVYGDVYQQDAFWPANRANLNEPYILRDVRGLSVTVYPFAYNPVQKVLRIYTDITVQVNYTDAIGLNELNANVSRSSDEYQKIYKRNFLNYSSEKYTPLVEGEPGRMLIISYGDYMDEMADFVTWKREKGIETEIVDVATIGGATVIETYIENEFNINGLNYVLLVGDGNHVPTTTTGDDSDNEYVYILGNDHYADCFIGRLSAESGADVTTQITKIIDYERDYDTSNSWLENALGSASVDGTDGQGDDGESDEQHMDNICTDLEAFGYTVTHSNQDGGNNTIISNVVNAGIGVANYVGHGDVTLWVNTNYTNAEVNALTNNGKYPFIWSVACVNGNFNGNTCFAEAWLRATNGSEPSGAVAFLGSTINQAWAEPMDGQDEMNDILVESYVNNIKRTFGGLSFNGMFHMLDEYPSSGEAGMETADTWTIFGDPSMMVRSKTPAEMSVSHLDVLNVGQASFTVNCNADGALVSLTTVDEGETVILGTAYVSGGSASVDIIPFTEPGNMKVTVTAYNKVTYQDDVLVIVPSGPYVVLNDVVVDDAVGNADGFLNNNETVLLDVVLENVGVDLSSTVNAVLTSVSTDLTINDDTEAYGDIVAEAVVNAEGAYEIALADGVEDQSIITLDFAITDAASNAWNGQHNVTVYAPSLKVNFVSLNDDVGNGNGVMDPGETVIISFEVENTGHNVASAGSLTMNIAENASCDNSTADVTVLSPGESLQIDYTVNVDAGVTSGASMPASLMYVAGAYDAGLNVNLPIGLQLETWESNDFASYAWENDATYPWVIATDEVYEGTYAAKSGAIGDDQSSVLTINVNVTSAGDISFFKKVSCEEASWWIFDYLAFSLDGSMEDQWEGEVDWSEETYAVGIGEHQFKWEYVKDGSQYSGQDAAWVDNILLPPHDNLTIIEQMKVPVDEFSFAMMPNPTAGMTFAEFSLTDNADVKLELLDMTGRVIETIYNQASPEGTYRVGFDASELSNGMFIIRLTTDDKSYTQQLMITK